MKKRDQPQMVTMAVKVPEDLRATVAEKASKDGQTVSAYLRKLLTRWFSRSR